MALPKVLSDWAYKQHDHTMETGGRSQTQTTTNYGVIGDAFFKKSQIDLQIADLRADMGYKKASLLSGLEMQRAQLELDKGKLQLDAAQMAEEQRRWEESQEVSDSEQLLGTLGGVAQGALAGFTVGGVPGAIAGGAIGGVTTYGSYESGGRAAGQQAQQTLGTIANVATTFKTLRDEQVKKDAWQGIAKTGGDLIAQYNQASTPQEQFQAMQAMDAHIGNVYQQAMSMPGANPEQVGTMVANYRKGLETSLGITGTDAQKRNHFKQLENLVNYQADSRKDNPKTQRAWAMDYLRDSSAIYAEETGKKMPISMGLRNLEQLQPGASKLVTGKQQQSAGTFGQMNPGTNTGGRTTSPSANQVPGGGVTPPRTTSTPAPVPERSAPVPFSNGGIPFRPLQPSGPGIEMDDGGSADYTPVSSEQKLTDQGTEVAKMGIMDKIKHNMSLSDEEFDEKRIPLWEDASADDARRGDEADTPRKKIGGYEEFMQANEEIDMQINEAAAASPEGVRAKGAIQQVDNMIELVEGEQFPAGSQMKQFGAKVYDEGLDVGGAAGALIGGAVAKGRGAAAGAFIGNQQNLRFGEGMGPFLSDEEETAVSAMNKYKAAATMKFAKIQDPGGKISDADAKRFENLWPRPGQSREQQLSGLLTIKQMMLDELQGASDAGQAEQDMKMKEFERKEQIKAKYKKPTAPKAVNSVEDLFGGNNLDFELLE